LFRLAGTQSVHIVVDEFAAVVFVGGVINHPIAGSPVSIDSNGQLGVAPSAERFKDEIKPVGQVSEAILALKPVRFRYKKEVDPKGSQQFGLIAEDVEKVNSDLVVHDVKGKPYSVRYEAVNAMLLNEFLKEHSKVQQLEATVTQLMTWLKEQDLEIQKINDRLKISQPATKVVANR
jgi:Chaperone of endosialidase